MVGPVAKTRYRGGPVAKNPVQWWSSSQKTRYSGDYCSQTRYSGASSGHSGASRGHSGDTVGMQWRHSVGPAPGHVPRGPPRSAPCPIPSTPGTHPPPPAVQQCHLARHTRPFDTNARPGMSEIRKLTPMGCCGKRGGVGQTASGHTGGLTGSGAVVTGSLSQRGTFARNDSF